MVLLLDVDMTTHTSFALQVQDLQPLAWRLRICEHLRSVLLIEHFLKFRVEFFSARDVSFEFLNFRPHFVDVQLE